MICAVHNDDCASTVALHWKRGGGSGCSGEAAEREGGGGEGDECAGSSLQTLRSCAQPRRPSNLMHLPHPSPQCTNATHP
mmetsp:Transcript_20109/g.59723  ORF Transcript_20109/g.59723 Transcript_20109/m.59723 type:complete len:80 (+) Transcript_20109:572-811(+)